jgi:pilus assembly protein Flp/PilA
MDNEGSEKYFWKRMRNVSLFLAGAVNSIQTGKIVRDSQEKNQMIKRFVQEEEGQTLVEYGLLISLIALVVIAVLTVMGRRISNTFNTAANGLAS